MYSIVYDCFSATSYKAELSTAKPKAFTPGHLSLPTSALNDLYLILTSLFTLPHWLCSSHKSLLAVPRYPRQAPTQGHCPCSGKLTPQGHCQCCFLCWAATSIPNTNCKACLCNYWKSLFSCHFRETFPKHTLVKTANPAHQKSTYPHFSPSLLIFLHSTTCQIWYIIFFVWLDLYTLE